MGKSRIEWTDKVWNVITGCSHAGSPGCDHCYAKRMATRLKGRFGYPKDDPFRVTFHPDRLDEPFHWKRPCRIFVCSMGDLFHENVTFEMIKQVFMRAANSKRHTYFFLTKRPQRMAECVRWFLQFAYRGEDGFITLPGLPDNFWFGVSVEDQKTYDERASILSRIECAHRFISFEPLLGPVETEFLDWRYDWVICGGETGPGARSLHPDWVRSLRDQCQSAGVPFFFKSWGEWEQNKSVIAGAISYQGINPKRLIALNDRCLMERVGKKKAGRLLDGKIWEEMP